MKMLECRDMTGTLCLMHSTAFKPSGMVKVNASLEFSPTLKIYRKKKIRNLKKTALKER